MAPIDLDWQRFVSFLHLREKFRGRPCIYLQTDPQEKILRVAWWDQILAVIRECDVFLFVLAPESLDSAACKREYKYASALGKTVLPVLVAPYMSIPSTWIA